MKTLFWKDRNRRFFYNKTEKKKYLLLYIYHNLTLSFDLRLKAYLEYVKLCEKSHLTKVRNRCILTNRARGVYQKFKLSRSFFKKYSLIGELPGIKKASW